MARRFQRSRFRCELRMHFCVNAPATRPQCSASRMAASWVIAMLAACIGCGQHGLPTVPVSGRVTFSHGPCPAVGSIAFSPISTGEGMPRRPGTATFAADGVFQATSFKSGDGLLPGRYRAIVSCWTGEPTSADLSSFERFNSVPRNYQPQEFVVESGAKSLELAIDVPLKK
jgi:hypothetical protein